MENMFTVCDLSDVMSCYEKHFLLTGKCHDGVHYLGSRHILLLLCHTCFVYRGLQGSVLHTQPPSAAQNAQPHFWPKSWVIRDGISPVHLNGEVLWDSTLVCSFCPPSVVKSHCPRASPLQTQGLKQHRYSNKTTWHYFHATQFCRHRYSCTCDWSSLNPHFSHLASLCLPNSK